MANRTKSETTSIDVSRSAKDRLKNYQVALQSEMSRRATMGEIVEALLWGVPLWQADAMLGSYRSQGKPWEEDPASDQAE